MATARHIERVLQLGHPCYHALMAWRSGALNLKKIQEAVFLTAKTTSMVCWLFVGSALFSAVTGWG